MPRKKFSLSSSEEDDSELLCDESEGNESFVQKARINDNCEDGAPKSRKRRVLRTNRAKVPVFSEDSGESCGEDQDSDYEPEVIEKVKVMKGKAAAAPKKNVSKPRAKKAATVSSPKLTRKRKSSEPLKSKGIRTKKTRWDSQDDDSLAARKDKNELLVGNGNSNEMEGFSENLKTENPSNECIESSGSRIKKPKTKKTTAAASPSSSNLSKKRKSSESLKSTGVRVKKSRWDTPKSENTHPLAIKRDKDELLFGNDDSNDMGMCSRSIKTENLSNARNESCASRVKEEHWVYNESVVSCKIESEGFQKTTAPKKNVQGDFVVNSGSKSIKGEISDFSSTYERSHNDPQGISQDTKGESIPLWKAVIEEPDACSKQDNGKKIKVDAADVKKYQAAWEEAQVLSEDLALDYWIAKNIVRLLDEDNTIPFIARYRKEMTGNMSPEDLRKVKEAYETLKQVKTKAANLVATVEKMGKLTKSVENEILCARSLGELDHIKSLFKTAPKGTLADRARELGLETPAVTLLCGNSMDPICLAHFVCHQKTKGLADIKEVETGMQHIIADIISKDREVQDNLRKLKNTSNIFLSCTKSKTATAKAKKSPKAKKPEESKKGKTGAHAKAKEDDETKYQNYFNFKNNVRFIRPHQVLAINRGEKNKILSVKIESTGYIKSELFNVVHGRWLNQGLNYPLRYKIVEASFNDAYERLIFPLLVRLVRSELTQMAETASVEVFATNLKNLLLQPPLRGKIVMGLDPGFKNGCKLCVISQTGEVLYTDVLYPKFGYRYENLMDDYDAIKLKRIVDMYRCETIALGNGTACRETEEYLSNLIQLGWFRPFDVVYTIVSEQGASIYSCSPEAQKEFPKMDTNVISAVSIARRLQDPLAELVKIEARHLGVGMYQHDISDSKLRSTLDEVVIECVSFVGVDLNAASHCILRKISGMNAARAQNILDWKSCNGPFRNREQLKTVKGIGAKSFEQCAGFVRILPQTCFVGSDSSQNPGVSNEKKGKKTKAKEVNCDYNPLDSTWIHPESYSVAERMVAVLMPEVMEVRCKIAYHGSGFPLNRE
ncbi:S1 RNA-binding domain-containing protein 1 isoform X2 [Ischnura elegans]|uniref:S1 RNA-binding domain-containing protein 1 isoform X2 n=1 Tax=Ischnura elegans TaxID=197161 RepID=UPI001ED86695|nr:S1 RNA-binding domain-containing protein 1 isoform X2 [Ischnura elegans]